VTRTPLSGRSLQASMPFARSDADGASPSWLRLSAYAGERGAGHPKPPVFGGAQSPIRRRLALSAETVGGHAQKKGVVEDYWLLIKTHETETLNTTVFEHAYRPSPNAGGFHSPCTASSGRTGTEACPTTGWAT